MYRDLENVPYRDTKDYKRARKVAAAQKATIRHRVRQLWPSQSGQSTSGMLRRPWFGYAV